MTDSLPNFNSDRQANQDFEKIGFSNDPHLSEPKTDGVEFKYDDMDHFYSQIKKIPPLLEQTSSLNQPLIRQLQSVQYFALKIIQTFQEHKATIIRHYDFWLQPVAKEVLDGLLCEAEELKQQLSSRDFNLEKGINWEEYIQRWEDISDHWVNRKALSDRILTVVSERVIHCIDKDIKVIQDYQNHHLANVKTEQNKRDTLQKRLSQVTEQPLKQLVALRDQTYEHTSLIQAAEWLASFQEERESYFDQLLVKIDAAVRDIVDFNDKEDVLSDSAEDEGEIVFMERELESILLAIDLSPGANETDIMFTECRLESLLDHLEEIDLNHLPHYLQKRVSLLREQIHEAFDEFKQM